MDRQDFETKLIDWLDRPEESEELTSDLQERHQLQAWRHFAQQVRQNLHQHEPPAAVDQAILRAARKQAEQYTPTPQQSWLSWFLQSWQPIATFATLTLIVGMTFVLSKQALQESPSQTKAQDFAPSSPSISTRAPEKLSHAPVTGGKTSPQDLEEKRPLPSPRLAKTASPRQTSSANSQEAAKGTNRSENKAPLTKTRVQPQAQGDVQQNMDSMPRKKDPQEARSANDSPNDGRGSFFGRWWRSRGNRRRRDLKKELEAPSPSLERHKAEETRNEPPARPSAMEPAPPPPVSAGPPLESPKRRRRAVYTTRRRYRRRRKPQQKRRRRAYPNARKQRRHWFKSTKKKRTLTRRGRARGDSEALSIVRPVPRMEQNTQPKATGFITTPEVRAPLERALPQPAVPPSKRSPVAKPIPITKVAEEPQTTKNVPRKTRKEEAEGKEAKDKDEKGSLLAIYALLKQGKHTQALQTAQKTLSPLPLKKRQALLQQLLDFAKKNRYNKFYQGLQALKLVP